MTRHDLASARKIVLCAGLCSAAAPFAAAQDDQRQNGQAARPNILWLTFEDTSAYEFGCYGNPDVRTPVADSLAARGVMFTHAWSNAPQSSPARSSLITGCYATTYGMDLHPVAFDTPGGIFFPERLRAAGYWCTNNNKTHYNTTRDNAAIWDECSREASYNSPGRAEGQPFFAVYNTVTSHMGRVRTFHTEGRRDYREEGLDPERLSLPPYVPDLEEVRSDYAGHLEAVQDVDKWLGIFLADLRDRGLADDTIIFFFSDHGGCLPRGKGYLYESGLRVPLIVYFPERWRHLAAGRSGADDTLVSFVDLAPTVLSIAGVKPPKYMQGRPVFGKYAIRKEPRYEYAFAANQLHHFSPVRAVSDGRYKYIRSYLPYRQFALRNYYQWGMPANRAWDALVIENGGGDEIARLPYAAHPAEMLFDLDNDPGEVHDLSADPQYASKLRELREALRRHVRETGDLGFFLPETRASHDMYTWVRESRFPLRELQDLADLASKAVPKDTLTLLRHLSSDIPEMRFWAAAGYAVLGRGGAVDECPDALLSLLDDPNAHVACEAAYAACYLGHAERGVERMLHPRREEERKIGYSALECLSLDPDMHPAIMAHVSELWQAARTLPRKDNEDAGLMARGILVNIHQMPVADMYGSEAYEQGLKLNHGRRPIKPLP